MTWTSVRKVIYDSISTHTPLAGRDRLMQVHRGAPNIFLLTRPLRDVTSNFIDNGGGDIISTHTPLAGRDFQWDGGRRDALISTHTPLAGRDGNQCPVNLETGISTHTPLAGRDYPFLALSASIFLFLLTRPLRDVTACQVVQCALNYFYSHAPCGT